MSGQEMDHPIGAAWLEILPVEPAAMIFANWLLLCEVAALIGPWFRAHHPVQAIHSIQDWAYKPVFNKETTQLSGIPPSLTS